MKNKNYDEFVEKFKPKKTTDDCYTPENVYSAVAEWIANEYKLNTDDFVRPFYPGGDYENFDYNNKIVVDNPPFSILSKIIKFYIDNDVKFFLFAPTLTLFSGSTSECSVIPIGIDVVYENGARVSTSFATNLEPRDVRIRTVPELYKKVYDANQINIKSINKQLPKYTYPPYVVTAAKLRQYSKAGIELTIPRSESFKVSGLDSQKTKKKAIFGSGYLISERCKLMVEKAEKEKAEKERAEKERAEKIHTWMLSDREFEIINDLSR